MTIKLFDGPGARVCTSSGVAIAYVRKYPIVAAKMRQMALGADFDAIAPGRSCGSIAGRYLGRYNPALEVLAMIVEIDRESDGRWIAEIPDLPGVIVYGHTRDEAIARAQALALRAMADRLDHGEAIPELKEVFAIAS